MTFPRHRLCRGLFIVFEGVDGAGKTTGTPLSRAPAGASYDVVCLKEPTEGPWGQKLRQLAQHGRQEIPPATELEWFLQDRREDVEHNIQPALARGQIVVLDRYYFSTIAYQGALQLDPEEIGRATKPLRRLQILYFSCTFRLRRDGSVSDNEAHSVTSSA